MFAFLLYSVASRGEIREFSLPEFTLHICCIFYYIKLKSRLSIRPFVHTILVAWISVMGAWIDVRLVRHDSYVFWHDEVYFKKFLRALILQHECAIDTYVDPD